MIHICHEEVFALMQAIPGIKFIVPYMKMKWHKWRGCHKKHIEEKSDEVSDVQK